MDSIEIIGLIGSGISIISAIVSIVGVQSVKKAKKEVFQKFRIMKNSEFITLNRNVLNQLRKISSSEKIPIGQNFPKLIEDLNNYYENLSRLRHDNLSNENEKLDSHLENLKQNIADAKLIDRNESQKIITKYTEIYYQLIDIENDVSKMNKEIIEK